MGQIKHLSEITRKSNN